MVLQKKQFEDNWMLELQQQTIDTRPKSGLYRMFIDDHCDLSELKTEKDWRDKADALVDVVRDWNVLTSISNFLDYMTPYVIGGHDKPDVLVRSFIQMIKFHSVWFSGMSQYGDACRVRCVDEVLMKVINDYWKHKKAYFKLFSIETNWDVINHTTFLSQCFRPKGTYHIEDESSLQHLNRCNTVQKISPSQVRALRELGFDETMLGEGFVKIELQFGQDGTDFLVKLTREVQSRLERWVKLAEQEYTGVATCEGEFLALFNKLILEHPEWHIRHLGRMAGHTTASVLLHHWRDKRKLATSLGVGSSTVGCGQYGMLNNRYKSSEAIAMLLTFQIPFYGGADRTMLGL